MSSLTDVLNKRARDIDAPKALPPGTYLGIVDGNFTEVQSQEKRTPGAQFMIRLLQPINVSDDKALAEAGGCVGKTVRHTLYVTENSEFFLKSFLVDHLGIDEGDKTIAELLSEAPGKQVGVVLRNTLSKGTEPRLIHIVEGTVKV